MTNHKTRKNLIAFTFLFALGVGLSAVWPNFYQPEASAASIVIEDSDNVYRAANITRGETTYRNEVEASPGEAIQFLVMVHLGAENTSAGNVSVKVDLSDLTTKTFITSSENNVEDTVKIIVPSDQDLVFIPEHGVVLTTHGNLPSNVPTTPYTWSNPDELFGSGLALGNINSLSAVYISFKAYVSNKTANMAITKEVTSVDNPDGAWHDSINVERGEKVRFQIVVNNTGGSELNDVLITDELPEGLEYAPGSAEYSTPYSGGFKSLADSWMAGHANLGKLLVGEGYNAIIVFDALVKEDAAEGEHRNTAQAKANEYPDWIYDWAKVSVEVPTPTPTPGEPQISIEKKVIWNGPPRLGSGEAGSEYDSVEKSVHLYDAGEEVVYKLYVKNSGDAEATGVKVIDYLPAYIRDLDGKDEKTFNIGTLGAGEEWSDEYTARVVKDLPQNDRTQENRAEVTSSNAGSDEDTAFIWINGPEILAADVAAAVSAAPAEELPATGPAVPVVFGLLSALPVGVFLRRRLV